MLWGAEGHMMVCVGMRSTSGGSPWCGLHGVVVGTTKGVGAVQGVGTNWKPCHTSVATAAQSGARG